MLQQLCLRRVIISVGNPLSAVLSREAMDGPAQGSRPSSVPRALLPPGSVAAGRQRRRTMDAQQLARLLQRVPGRTLLIDCRTFSEYNASHVLSSINVCCSKLVKRRLQQNRVSVGELLQPGTKVKVKAQGEATPHLALYHCMRFPPLLSHVLSPSTTLLFTARCLFTQRNLRKINTITEELGSSSLMFNGNFVSRMV